MKLKANKVEMVMAKSQWVKNMQEYNFELFLSTYVFNL